MDTQQRELLNWKRLIITTLLVVVASAVTSSLTWFILDRTFNESQQMNAALVETLEKRITYLDTKLGGSTATGTETTAIDPLTQVKILNATYKIDGSSYTVVNGTVKVGENTVTIKADKSVVNSDSAFVVLNINMGGTGVFYYLAYMTNNAGSPAQADIISLGDRTLVNSITYANGSVTLDMLTVGPNDSSSTPTQKLVASYNIVSGKLVKI